MEFNYNKTYYKVTNEKECHNGLQYKTGLIKDIVPFDSDPDKTCVKGRIYFTDLEHLPKFFSYGCWIRPLTVPEDAQIVIEKDKIGTDQIVMQDRITFKEYFTTWFDPDKFNWDYSYYLAQYCSEDFHTWFDTDKFDWDYSHSLAQYCSEDFHTWFDTDKYNWYHSYYLAQYCSEDFHTWFDPDKFDWYHSYSLAQYCSEDFHTWFDPDKFDWDYSHPLAQYCSEHKNIWSKYIKK